MTRQAKDEIHDDPLFILQDSLVQQASGEQLSEHGRGAPAHPAVEVNDPQEEVSTSLPAEARAANHPGAAHGLLVQLHLEQGVLEVAAEPPGSRQGCSDCSTCNVQSSQVVLVRMGLLELFTLLQSNMCLLPAVSRS